ncbi:hypothetical protein CEXT_80151 [Caerostris extrusa]|uniref:Uncharacterized protein n=1 Tax=Caerostris extrusa TaxID=172846 RepID=A0AAV4NH78_CAEEX|nr:hypothetical protein CEXT_80151 [Caerostris extrusa]
MDEEESSVQHTGHWKRKEEKGCWEIDGKWQLVKEPDGPPGIFAKNDSGTNNIANPYQRNKDPPFCFQGKTKPEPTDHVFGTFFFPSPQLFHASKFEMSPLIVRESDQKIDRATRKKKYETARMVEEESSVQHTGHWKRKKEGKKDAGKSMVNGSWSKNQMALQEYSRVHGYYSIL